MGFHDFLIAEGERKTAQNSSVVFSLVHGIVRGPPRSFWHPPLYIDVPPQTPAALSVFYHLNARRTMSVSL